MNRTILKFSVILISFLSNILAVQGRNVSREEALSIVMEQKYFSDADYYSFDPTSMPSGSFSSYWYFFIDADPLKGWEHECYIARVPKQVTTLSTTRAIYQLCSCPPDNVLIPLVTHNRNGGINSHQKPLVSNFGIQTNSDAAQRTFAVILSGGINKNTNYERYWNDCSFVYQTLIKKYSIPKENISVVMSDGTNPAEDMYSVDYTYISSPLDLDFDGENDIQYAATRYNIQNILSNLASVLQPDDHLFFFVIDHGGKDAVTNHSYICLWGNEKIYDYELASWLSSITENFVNVNVVLGQCFSGGFIDDLDEVGCVVSTASSSNEYSYACGDMPYDEFVYHWTSAINEKSACGDIVYSDFDGNGHVTMDEAFYYASSNDRKDEHPQYNSNPQSIGEDLSFDELVPSVDLYIRDTSDDSGKEPCDVGILTHWNSPDIWIRNTNDNIEVHENPIYSPSDDHYFAFINVRVHNRGKARYNSGKWLHVYWAQSSTGISKSVWKGRETYNDEYVTGGPLEPIRIPPIEPGSSIIIVVPWALPTGYSNYWPNYKHHYGILARIMDTSISEAFTSDDPDPFFDVMGDNNIAEKNICIIHTDEMPNRYGTFIRNIVDDEQEYSLEIMPLSNNANQIFSLATVSLEMSTTIYNDWVRGGCETENVTTGLTNNPNIINLQNIDSKIKRIRMSASEFDFVSLRIDYNLTSSINDEYAFALVQKDNAGAIIGGQTFIIKSPDPNLNYPRRDVTNFVNGYNKCLEGICDLSYNNRIESIQHSKDSPNILSVIFSKECQCPESKLLVNSIVQGNCCLIKDLSMLEKQTIIDIESLPNGIYSIQFIENGKIIDDKRFIKQ